MDRNCRLSTLLKNVGRDDTLVIFYNKHCALCEAVRSAAERSKHKIILVEVDNVRNCPSARTYKVSEVPAILMFKKGFYRGYMKFTGSIEDDVLLLKFVKGLECFYKVKNGR